MNAFAYLTTLLGFQTNFSFFFFHLSDTWHNANFDIFSEPNGREQSIVQNNHHISMVPTLLGHSLFEQERSFRREDHVFASGRLLP